MIKAWLFDAADYQPHDLPFDQRIAADLMADHLDLWTKVEEMGFDGIFFSEHHFVSWCMSPSPNLLVAATAARTSRIRLGVMAQLVPMQAPWRIMEECAMLDLISNGRLEIGVARGLGMFDLGRVGDGNEARARFEEGVKFIDLALSQETVSFDGQFVKVKDLTIMPRFVQKPAPPKWMSVRTPIAASVAARRGYKACSGLSSTAEVKESFDAYRDAAKEINAPAGPDQLGVRRHILVGESDAETREEARLGMEREAQKMGGSGSFLYQVLSDGRDLIAGSPQSVAEQIVDQCRTVGAGHILKHLPGSFSRAVKWRSCELFAREVIPILHRADVMAEVPV